MGEYPRVMEYVRAQPWAVRPETLAVMLDLLRFRHQGGRLGQEEIRARLGVKAERSRERRYDPDTDEYYRETWDPETGAALGYRAEASGAPLRSKGQVVAVLGVIGLLAQRAAMVDDVSGPGGTSIERLTARFRAALADQQVRAIVLDVDSPGGGVYGVQELADEIREARGQKPVAAVANSAADSAAYWLAAQAGELVVTPSGEVGSVGIFSAHEDLSKALDTEGVKVTLVSAGKFKVEGNPFEPLSPEALDAMQAKVDDYYASFVRTVAKGRSSEGRRVTPEDVRRGYGQGRSVLATQAVAEGMADRVGTLDETVRRYGGRRAATAVPAAAAVEAEYEAAAARLRLL